jgi:DNA-3-methyladenine glycosylase II
MVSEEQDRQPVREFELADLVRASTEMLADVESLSGEHALFADLLDRNGPPPLWRRDPTFETLVRFILEQQVSLASANAAFKRLDDRLGGVTPQAVLASTDSEMKADGFSRQKTGYVRGIADLILSGDFNPAHLPSDSAAARDRLLHIRGIGPWTASCYLLFVCGDRDTWPTGDRALYVSIANNLDLADVPDTESGDLIASEWAPWRSTAAKMLWHDYLGGRSHVPVAGAGFIEGTGKVRP